MNGMDGRQLVEKLRGRPATMNVAVVSSCDESRHR